MLLSYVRQVDRQLVPDVHVAQRDLENHCARVVLIPAPSDRRGHTLRYLLKFPYKLPYSVHCYSSDALAQTVVDMVQECQTDIVHVDTIGLIDQVADRLPAVKVLTHHNIESAMMFRRAAHELNPVKKGLFYYEASLLREYERTICPRYDINVVVSDPDRDTLTSLNSNIKATVIENGVDCHHHAHHYRNEDSKGLVFVGLLDWAPNSEAMLFFCKSVWPILQCRFDALTLTIIGRNPPPMLSAVVAKSSGVILKGFVPDTHPYIKAARIFICPLQVGGGTRLKILDALAQGIPVISTSVGCEGLALEDGTHLLIANTPDEFVHQISRLLHDEVLCNRLSLNGRRLAEEQYAFPLIGEKLSGLYEQLTRSKCRNSADIR